MEDKKIYVKRGRKYEPIAEYYTTDHLGYGTYLLHICKGSRSFTLMLKPEYANILAALREHRDESCKILMESLKYNHKEVKLTERAKELWNELSKELNKKDLKLFQKSAHDVIEDLFNFLSEKVKEK